MINPKIEELFRVISKKLETCKRMEQWRMHDLRMERLEYAIEEGEEYQDDVGVSEILPDLTEHCGPQGYLFNLVNALVHHPNVEEIVRDERFVKSCREIVILNDAAKDFGFTMEQLRAMYNAFPDQEYWVDGDLQEMHRKAMESGT